MPVIHMNDWPPFADSDQNRREGSIVAAKLMANAAQTAPKAGGIDQIECAILYGKDELDKIAKKIEELSLVNTKNKLWERIYRTEGIMVREADCILLVGNYRVADSPLDLGCGLCGGAEMCGYVYNRKSSKYGQIDSLDNNPEKKDWLVKGPLCSFFVGDLGYAVGAATFMAKQLLIDTRPLVSVGIAGQKLGYCKESEMVVGLPIAALPKNPFVDVFPDYHMLNRDKFIKQARKNYVVSRMVHWFDYRSWYPKNSDNESENEEVK